jgi:hypothetical protein
MPAAPRTPITPFRFAQSTLDDLDTLAGQMTTEEGRTITRPEVVRLLARRELARRERATKRNPEKSAKTD